MLGRPPLPIDEATDAGRLGARIRRTRLRRKLTVTAAARLAGYSTASWSRWERGIAGITTETLAEIAAVLGVRPKTLMP